ncbi:MAG: hypothetical protein KDJ20_15000 [Hyphomicrobiales bacterium]|nr:hypothetical protein [Hyphomicrobiales bacterium]MCC2108205.1 hypothetical protein [Hyphomicrobiales bacterium]
MKAIISALCLSGFVLISASSGASATTCSARNAYCKNYCATKARGARCTVECADAFPVCMQTGCYKTKMSNKCGFTKS